MARYNYSVAIYTINTLNEQHRAELHSTLTGEVDAERYSTACIEAWKPITTRCSEIRAETGKPTGVGNIHVEVTCE